MTAPVTRGSRQPGLLQGISLLMPITLSVMAALFVAPIAPKIAEQFIGREHMDPNFVGLMIGLIITIPALCVAIFSPFAGALGDRFGRRRLLIWAMSVYSIVGVMPYFLNDLKLIVASRVVVGIVEAVLMTTSTTLIGDYFDGESRNRWLAAQTGVASTAAVIVIIVAGVVGQNDWHNVFLLYLIPLIFLAMVLMFTWEPEESAHLRDANAHAPWSALPWKLLGIICAITLFGAVMFYAVQIQTSVALKELGVLMPNGDYDSARGGKLTALASICVPVGTVCFWWLSPRAKLATQFVVEFAVMGIGFVLMSRASSPFHFALFAGLNQIGAGMLLPTLLTWAVKRLPFEMRGRGTGIWTSIFSLGQFACNNAAVPLIMGTTGGLMVPAFGVLGWMCLAAGGAALALRFLGKSEEAA